MAMLMRSIAGLAISLRLLKPPPSLTTKQCNGRQLCICGTSQTAGLARTGMDGCMDKDVEVAMGYFQGKKITEIHSSSSKHCSSFYQGVS